MRNSSFGAGVYAQERRADAITLVHAAGFPFSVASNERWDSTPKYEVLV